MVTRVASGFSVQRVWLLLVIVVVLCGSVTQQASAWFTNDECPGVMGNRDLYEKVAWVCNDCANIFRINDVGVKCKKDCFHNMDFLWCVYATERHGEIDQFRKWISILRAGRK
uniref:Molt inhibiting hormone n=1 Tax=Nephrops norvegicus TaxID=6829 RepID=Q95P84_NEPNO|nr:prepro-gonad-inhibiting hormone [Nephrops norvegicus]QBX89053.1 molt inhibiting hormone [Nephrops norvegicus]